MGWMCGWPDSPFWTCRYVIGGFVEMETIGEILIKTWTHWSSSPEEKNMMDVLSGRKLLPFEVVPEGPEENLAH